MNGKRFSVQVALALAVLAAFGCSSDQATRRVLDARATHLDARARGSIASAVGSAAAETGLDPLLLLAVIEQESSYRVDARGPRGSRGLMQVRPTTAAAVARRHGISFRGEGSLHRPSMNVRLGALYLAELHESFGDRSWALTAYNRGPTAVRRLRKRPGAKSSVYARRVEARLAEMRAIAAR